MFLSVIVLLLIFISIAKTYRKRRGKAPKGLQSVIEPLIIFVRDEIARPNIGHQYHRFMPLLLTIFFFICINHLLGLIPFFPGVANVSGNIAFTFVLGMVTFVVTTVNGNRHSCNHFIIPSIPLWLYPF